MTPSHNSNDRFLLRAKDWALLLCIFTVLGFAWDVFAKVITAQNQLAEHEARLNTIEPLVMDLKQSAAVNEAHFQDMIARLSRIEKQTK